MTLYALDDVGDAFEVTSEFLRPVEARTWAKLALVVLFIGGAGGNVTSFQSSVGGSAGPVPDLSAGPGLWLLIAAIVGVALVVGLVFVLVGSIFEFVFVESLRREEVSIRQYWGQRWRQGVRLFAFRVALGLFLLGGGALLAASIVLPLVGFDPLGGLWLAGVVLLLPVFLVIAIVTGVVYVFTTIFVVPIMVLEDCGVVAGWRRLWPTITRDWKQYLAVALLYVGLAIAGGIVVGILTALSLLILFIPFGLLFAIAFGLFAFVSEVLGFLAFLVLGVAGVITAIAVVAVVQVPVQTYLRYYALLVLGDIEPPFDLIPDQRAAIRDAEATDV